MDGRDYNGDVDLKAWATGYYVATAFAGNFPKSPNLLIVEPQLSDEAEAEQMALRFEAWTQINNQRFKNTEEVTSDG